MKLLFRSVLWFGGTFAIFRYLGDFSAIQSLLLAVVSLMALEGQRISTKLASTSNPAFEPFWISIKPLWRSICQDHGLLTEEQWAQFQSQVRPKDAKYSVFCDGLSFVMLSDKLFYSNDHNSFFGELDLRINVEELKPEIESGIFWGFGAQLYIRRRVRALKKIKIPVIEIGIVTKESLRKGFDHRDDDCNIPLAYIPENLFFGYAHPDADWNLSKKIREQADAYLEEFGWTKDEHDSEFDFPLEVKHKYFWVSYKGI